MSFLAPRSAALFVAGLFAIAACPPFGLFFSVLLILRAAIGGGHRAVTALFLGSLLFAFFGLTRLVFAIVNGRPRAASKGAGRRFPEAAGMIAPPLILLGISLWLGVATPAVLHDAWTAAVARLFPSP